MQLFVYDLDFAEYHDIEPADFIMCIDGKPIG
jgi:hypothetical protein